jgi:hypothetical protein
MSNPVQYERFQNVESKITSRILLVVLVILGISGILSTLVLPEIAWVLIICFLYILALEAILLTNS